LHAHRLAFRHPLTGQPLSFEAPLPVDMQELIRSLR
jgi:23S rRNA-/tRNA-specific pseudouridylate synthase